MSNLSIPVQARAGFLADSLHQGQIRKGSGGNYFDEHLAKVAKIVESAGGSPVIIAGAFLHDAIEDQPERNPKQRILEECGPEVLALVKECTEIGPGGEEKAPWAERKRAYLDHLYMVSEGALLISVADKLQSARDDLKPYVESQGDSFYNIFKKAGSTTEERKANTIWFHRELASAFDYRYHALVNHQNLPSLQGLWALIVEFEAIVAWLEEN